MFSLGNATVKAAFGKKTYDPKMLIAKVNRDGLLPQEGPLDEHGDPMFGYGLSAVENHAKADDLRAPDAALPALNPFRAALGTAAPESSAVPETEDLASTAPVPARTITTPLPFGDHNPRTRVPSRPSGARSANKGGRRSVHATAIIRKPVVAHKRYLGTRDLPKHLLSKAMDVHAANLR